MRIAPERKDFPDAWYNVVPDLTFPAPNMRSPSGYRLGPHDLEPFVPDELIKQELEQKERQIKIPSRSRSTIQTGGQRLSTGLSGSKKNLAPRRKSSSSLKA